MVLFHDFQQLTHNTLEQNYEMLDLIQNYSVHYLDGIAYYLESSADHLDRFRYHRYTFRYYLDGSALGGDVSAYHLDGFAYC